VSNKKIDFFKIFSVDIGSGCGILFISTGGKHMGYTLTVTEIATGIVVLTHEYIGFSGNAMMDVQKYLYRQYPRDKYRIDW
jgi:hypothetical protein